MQKINKPEQFKTKQNKKPTAKKGIAQIYKEVPFSK